MITLFATARPFRGHVGVIQRNAVRSWMELCPPCEILLLGDDEGTSELAKEWRLRHVPQIQRNEFGTPLISSLFETAREKARYEILCQINADIMLTSDFLPAVRVLGARNTMFLAAGQRWDVDIMESWNFDQPDWQDGLRELVRSRGSLHPATGLDYFIFPRGAFNKLPAFAIGRRVLDNWLIFQARSLSMPVIDATRAITAIHQNHGYDFHPGGESTIMGGLEAQRNLELAGGWRNTFDLNDATHVLTSSHSSASIHLRRKWRTLPFPILRAHNNIGYVTGGVLRLLKRRILSLSQKS
ncbi:MAG TPA: hypothetical protein VFU31_26820 [Candidatus Binatia bacterium]|nr:hypothetical protein [Candidatus Binatia bacterium]